MERHKVEALHAAPAVGERVEVATRFTGTWSRGFTVADVDGNAFRLRRLSDGHVLPVAFAAHELRRDPSRGLTNESPSVSRPGVA